MGQERFKIVPNIDIDGARNAVRKLKDLGCKIYEIFMRDIRNVSWVSRNLGSRWKYRKTPTCHSIHVYAYPLK